MNYIVLDLEWNQACDSKAKKESPLLFEIVEIIMHPIKARTNIKALFFVLIKTLLKNLLLHPL